MKATVENVEQVLRNINVSTTEYLCIDKRDNNTVMLKLNPSYRYIKNTDKIESELEKHFELYMLCSTNIMLTSK